MHPHPIRAAVFDIDGTLAMMDKDSGTYAALPGAVDALVELQARGMPVVAYTNGTFFPPAHYYPLLADAGLVLEPGHILTPATVAARQLARMGVKRLLTIAADGTRVPLRDAGIEVALTGDGGEVDGVILGWTKDFGAADLEEAAQLLWAGKPLYATSIAPHFAGAKGRLLGISGAVAAALHNATGVKAKVFGKPETIGLEDISDMLGIPAREMVVIGDDPKLEIAMARKAGAFAVGVTTGTVDAAGFNAADAALRANIVLSGLDSLLAQGWW
jgi:4-nitrophenyl phosphatase